MLLDHVDLKEDRWVRVNIIPLNMQKNVVLDSLGLVDFAISLMNFARDLPNKQVKFFGGTHITEEL